MMKKIYLGAALAAALVAPQAFAQSAAFEGASAGFNVNFNSTTSEVSAGSQRLNGIGKSELGGSLQAAYGWGMGGLGVFSVGATYSLNDIAAGDLAASPSFSWKRKDAYSVYVEPGFKVSADTLAYAKLGYENASMRAESQGSSVSQTVDGYSYGFGIRSLMDRHLYLQAEVKEIIYNAGTYPGATADFKTSATVGSVGLGYQF